MKYKKISVKSLIYSFYCLIYCTFIVPLLKLSSGVFRCLCIIQIQKSCQKNVYMCYVTVTC